MKEERVIYRDEGADLRGLVRRDAVMLDFFLYLSFKARFEDRVRRHRAVLYAISCSQFNSAIFIFCAD